MQVTIETPDTRALIANAELSLGIASDYKITTQKQYIDAAEKLKVVKSFAAQWEQQRKELKAPILEAGKKIDDMFRAPKDRLDAIERVIKAEIVRYNTEQERIRKEEERKAEEAARKERERIEAQARAAQEKAQREAADLAAKAQAEIDAGNAAAAQKLQTKAESVLIKAADKVDDLSMRAQSVVAHSPSTEPAPKVGGLKLRTRWHAEVTDAKQVPREYMIVDVSALNKIAEATKGAISIPGVRFYSKVEAASSRR